MSRVRFTSLITFQSTLSVRRATRITGSIISRNSISIHALRKESDLLNIGHVDVVVISIHALRKESD